MAISTFEGVVENGAIRLRGNVTLPENTRVYVVVPDVQAGPCANVPSPRLAHPEQAGDFAKEIVEAPADDKL
jgi:hypothetical protein